MMTDPIADMLTRIRNATMVRSRTVLVPYSNLKFAIANLIASEGFAGKVEKVENEEKRPMIKVELLYVSGASRISGFDRVSKPGLRVYVPADEIKRVCNGYGISVLSTSKGIMSGNEARKTKIGGELLCNVY